MSAPPEDAVTAERRHRRTCCAIWRRRSSALCCGGSGDFDTAEDAVQEALLAAATQWPNRVCRKIRAGG